MNHPALMGGVSATVNEPPRRDRGIKNRAGMR
jgi:hypothetical protein